MELFVLSVSLVTSAGLLVYSVRGWAALCWLLRARLRRRPAAARAGSSAASLRPAPRLTTQITICDDGAAAERIIRAAVALQYPRGRHDIQVVDDSTDETRVLVQRVVRELRQAGHHVSLLHRPNRKGGRVGALAFGLSHAAGELVAVLDPELVPPPDFLAQVVPLFLRDDRLGVVHGAAGLAGLRPDALGQSELVNEAAEIAARGIPAHCSAGASVWRRDAIHDAGGWQGDTLAPHLDLSYRARVRGWRMRHVTGLDVRTESPATVAAGQHVQARWSKGSIQVALKLLPRIWRTPLPRRSQLSATLHLTEPLLHPLALIGILLVVPAAEAAASQPAAGRTAIVGLLVSALVAPHALYLASQLLVSRRGWRQVMALPAFVCLGIGAAVANSRAVFEAAMRRSSPLESDTRRASSLRSHPPLLAWIEATVGAYCAIGLGMYLSLGRIVLAPLLFAYAVGFLVTGVSGLRESYEHRAARLRRLLEGRRALPRAAARALRPRSAG